MKVDKYKVHRKIKRDIEKRKIKHIQAKDKREIYKEVQIGMKKEVGE